MGREQKAAFGLLIVLGMSGLVLGILYFKNRVQISFPISKNDIFNFNEESLISLQSKDTDGDGLSDYDELYFYNTSPYIEDTDSDGFGDKEEIDDGENPICPRGEDCGAVIENENVGGLDELRPSEQPPTENPLDAIKSLNIGELRSLLKESGIDEETLGQISDMELESLYQKTLQDLENIE